MVVGVALRKFTADEFQLMAEAGIFAEDDRLELVQGEIIEMTPIGSKHSHAVDRLTKVLVVEFLPIPVVVRVQNPVRIDSATVLQPDFAVVDDRGDYYQDNIPASADVRLVVEVADSSLPYDRLTKGAIYAAAGIAEFWLVDLAASTVEVYKDPGPGGYATRRTAGSGEVLRPLSFPEITIAADLFLPRS